MTAGGATGRRSAPSSISAHTSGAGGSSRLSTGWRSSRDLGDGDERGGGVL